MCNNKVHETQPLFNLKADRVLQDIVYKIVPHLHESRYLNYLLPDLSLFPSIDVQFLFQTKRSASEILRGYVASTNRASKIRRTQATLSMMRAWSWTTATFTNTMISYCFASNLTRKNFNRPFNKTFPFWWPFKIQIDFMLAGIAWSTCQSIIGWVINGNTCAARSGLEFLRSRRWPSSCGGTSDVVRFVHDSLIFIHMR